jgi:hypothetical protein
VKLKLSFSETVEHLRAHIAKRLNRKPDDVFLVADETMSQELLKFSHEPEEANKHPVAQLVKPGATVNFQIGRSSGVGPFIPGTAAASESAKVQTGTDTYLICTRSPHIFPPLSLYSLVFLKICSTAKTHQHFRY